jgi:hypothetical protein
MVVRAIVNLGFVAHTERHSVFIFSFWEHKEAAQRPKLENWKVTPQSRGPHAGPRVFPRFRTGRAMLP